MIRWLILTSGVLICCNAALADTYSDCLRAPDKQVRLQACQSAANDISNTTAQRARAFRRLGAWRAEAGAHAQAVQEFTSAIALDPDDVAAIEKRALSLLVIGRLEEAKKDLTFAIARRPHVVRLYVERGYVHLVSKKYDDAIADFGAALARNPNHAVAFNNRGLAYRKKGDLKRAIQDYTSAIARAPTYAQALANRGYALEAAGQRAAATSDFQQALKFDPNMTGPQIALKRLGAQHASAPMQSLVKEGEQLVGTLCSRCHAIGRTGDSPHASAPRFRDLHTRYPLLALRVPISRGIAAPHDEMPKLHLRPEDIDKIVAYVNSLRGPGN